MTTRIDKYRLVRRLAVGGMAEIFLAEVDGLGGFQKQVVLKQILPQLAVNQQFVQMFLDEARLAATLHHPNIAQVFDIGRAGGSYFFTMEYVYGRDLREVCRSFLRVGKLMPYAHACAILTAACAGLHYAHEKLGPDGAPLHVVHRDVSPANVLVTFGGSVKIVDFGVAKARSHQTETRAGTLKGKISYMSPEQCRGEPLDRRADVFALGILMFELTTGSRLYRGDTDFQVLSRIVNEEPPRPSTRRPDYPPELEAIVMKALSRDREQRWATAEDMQLAIEELARKSGFANSPVALAAYMKELFGAELLMDQLDQKRGDEEEPAIELIHESDAPPRRRRLIWSLAATALAFSVGIGVVAGRSRKPAAPPPPVAAAPVQAPAPPAPPPVLPPAPPPVAAPPQTASEPPAHHHHSRHSAQPRKPDTKAAWDPDSALPP